MRGLKTFVLLFCLTATSAWSQQSMSGPKRPDGVDLGLRASRPSQVVIEGVPAYLWHHGCGPTAAGMVIGFWDSHGYPDLVSGDAFYQGAGANAMMADDGGNPVCESGALDHYQDYACPIEWSRIFTDKSELGGAHEDNCVADFMLTSRSSEGNKYGWSWFIHVARAFLGYAQQIYPGIEVSSQNIYWADYSWDEYKDEIDNNRPVVFLVDSWGNGWTDHFVTGIGYDEETGEYAIFDTWDSEIHWYRWHENTPGEAWGIYGITTFSLPVDKGHFAKGDFDCSGETDMDDIIALTDYLFNSGPCSACPEAADANGDGIVDTNDLIFLLNQ